MMTSVAKCTVLALLSATALSCATGSGPVSPLDPAQQRRLPIVDAMPEVPERASPAVPADDLLTFFPKAPSALASPPELRRFHIQCSVLILMRGGHGFFTLAVRDDGREGLFSLTPQPVTNLARTLFMSDADRGKQSMDWGFVYDRNGDGWADYLAFLDGALSVGTPDVLAQIPKRPTPQIDAEGAWKATITREEAALASAHVKLVFIHYVDDDFDGKTDGIVSALMDPDHWGWIYRRAVLRSRGRAQVVDEDWVFVEDIAVREGPIPRAPDGRFVKLEGLGSVREDFLEVLMPLFDYVNAGLRACRIPKGALPRG